MHHVSHTKKEIKRLSVFRRQTKSVSIFVVATSFFFVLQEVSSYQSGRRRKSRYHRRGLSPKSACSCHLGTLDSRLLEEHASGRGGGKHFFSIHLVLVVFLSYDVIFQSIPRVVRRLLLLLYFQSTETRLCCRCRFLMLSFVVLSCEE
jgi:hypothetical protein